jgi:hypothetical protein
VLIEHEGALIDYFADAHPYDLGKYARTSTEAAGHTLVSQSMLN